MEHRCGALVLGIGNVLWADEGFGVRAVEALHAAFSFSPDVVLVDGGTLGLGLYDAIGSARRVLVFDAIDFGLAPGTLRVLRNDEVPRWGRAKLSPHQNGLNDVLALLALNGRAPAAITAIGVQPQELGDFGGSLTEIVSSRVAEAVALAAAELCCWGLPGVPRVAGAACEPLNAPSLARSQYESGRPSAAAACRSGDARLLARADPCGKG